MMEFETETPAALMSRVQDGGGMFFERMAIGLREQAIQDNYDVIILDTPPSLGYITLSCLYAATGVVITTQAAMMDFASVSQWLRMLSGIHSNIKDAGATLNHNFIRFLLTRFNPNDSPQKMLAGVLRSCLGDYVLTHEALESTAIQAAGFAKRTIYELEPGSVGRDPLRRAQESIDGVNQEILDLISKAWGRK
jgi:chromosome partitioning protein